ncbi:MAG TPA: hypothetical protein VMU39_10240 [Solirubrobacteraceae bacterium]|nr:hypothetical protein [Solirubrobacteraceae bacterium]
MADKSVLYTAVYTDLDSALADLDAFDQLHKAEMIGKCDAAVINKQDGTPHIVKRVDHPGFRVIPEWLGRGALPRHELHDAAQALGPTESALIVVGEPTLEQGFEKAVTRAAKVVKKDLDVTTDELAKELINAVKS